MLPDESVVWSSHATDMLGREVVGGILRAAGETTGEDRGPVGQPVSQMQPSKALFLLLCSVHPRSLVFERKFHINYCLLRMLEYI